MIFQSIFSFILLTFTAGFPSSKFPVRQQLSQNISPTCGFQSCPTIQEGKLNVHLIPHTHDDVGWLKTVDQYFYGSHTETQNAGVQYILDSVINELKQDSNRKFIYVETAFFWKWWIKQHDIIKSSVRKLVNTGQLEFIGGAWSMNDEATTNYQSIIDQFTWGLRKLNDSFGVCGRPRVGWQIDPFGHSKEMASIFTQLGFDGLLFGRLDYQEKVLRMAKKQAEMIWEANSNLGDSANLFTSILFNNYSPPPGFCFDILCGEEPMIDDVHSPEYNVPRKVADFLNYTTLQKQHYSTNNIAVTMGQDFNYQDAHIWFKNMDKLIKYANEKDGNNVNIVYSTPSCYLKALNDANITWPTKSDDFFPYASDPHSYWTGYFSSRPTIKRFERDGNNYLQVCKQLYVLPDLGPEDRVDLNAMREAMGVMQHHDAITGTEKEAVAKDYARILTIGFMECDIITNTALGKLTQKSEFVDSNLNKHPPPPPPFQTCLLLNISQCEISEQLSDFVVTVYNPLSHPVSHYVRLPVEEGVYVVKGPNKKVVPSQIVPIPNSVLTIPGRFSAATHELVFQAVDLPALGFRSYYIIKSNKILKLSEEDTSENTVLYNKHLKVHLNNTSGKITLFLDKEKGIPIEQNFLYYVGFVGNNSISANRSSGAYIFRPKTQDAYNVSEKVYSKVYKGDIVQEIHQTFSDWISQVIRIYKEENHVEFEWLVGPIPINGTYGKEVISRYTTNLKSDGVFYTDSNGRQIIKRKRDSRPSWKLLVTEPVSGNYYPVTSKILLRDTEENIEVAVLTDRAQGGSSLRDGEMELMLHRRLLHDDAFGVEEALNETSFGKGLVARGKHFIIGGPITNDKESSPSLSALEKELALKKLLQPRIFFSHTNNLTFEEFSSSYNMEYSGLTKPLPSNVHILTLEPWIGRSLLLRLEHILEKDDDPILSKPATVNLKDLFKPFSIISARETTLGGNQWLAESEPLKWFPETNEIYTDFKTTTHHQQEVTPLTVTLTSMQIRTFVVEIDFHGI